MTTINRRDFVRYAGASLALPSAVLAQGKRAVAGLFAGRIDDRGFMQAGYEGLVQARDSLAVEIAFTQGIQPQKDLLAAALRDLAQKGPAIVIAHGGQNNEAAKLVAAEFPDVNFAVTQGNATGANLASYEVLQEQSAFLAGALAALTTKTGVVGHMSGIRVTPGLKGRAGFLHGVAHINPAVRVLTNFSGNQDDNALSHKVAKAMIDQKADVIFTMLNAGREGAIVACREGGIKQIGNVGDWVKRVPDVFIASAFADVGRAVFMAAQDAARGTFKGQTLRQIGVEEADAVRLIIADWVAMPVRDRIAALTKDIASGAVKVPHEWSGAEFPNPA